MATQLFVTGPTWTSNTPAGGPFNLAQVFQVSAPGSVTRLGFYRISAGMPTPNALVLWDVSLQTELARITSINDSGSVGWQWTDLSSPVNVSDHISYCVGAHIAAGSSVAIFSLGTLPTPGAFFGFSPPYRRFLASASVAFPTGNDSSLLYGFNAEYEPGGIQPPSLSDIGQTVDDKLFSWLTSTNDNVHQTELPWLTYGEAQSASAGAATAASQATSAANAANGNASAISNVSTQVDGIAGNVGTLLSRLSADLATKLNEMSDGLAGLLNDAASVLGGGWEAFVSQFTRASGGSGFGLPDSLAGWTLVDETDFTEEIAWPVAADRYVVTFTATPPRTPGTPVAGVDWHPRLAWWCELNTGLATERHYLDFAGAILQSPTGRMFGLLLNGGKDTAGHIQAWTKDA